MDSGSPFFILVERPVAPAAERIRTESSVSKTPSLVPISQFGSISRITGSFVPSFEHLPGDAKPPSTVCRLFNEEFIRMRWTRRCQSGHLSVGGINVVFISTCRSPQGNHRTVAVVMVDWFAYVWR